MPPSRSKTYAKTTGVLRIAVLAGLPTLVAGGCGSRSSRLGLEILDARPVDAITIVEEQGRDMAANRLMVTRSRENGRFLLIHMRISHSVFRDAGIMPGAAVVLGKRQLALECGGAPTEPIVLRGASNGMPVTDRARVLPEQPGIRVQSVHGTREIVENGKAMPGTVSVDTNVGIQFQLAIRDSIALVEPGAGCDDWLGINQITETVEPFGGTTELWCLYARPRTALDLAIRLQVHKSSVAVKLQSDLAGGPLPGGAVATRTGLVKSHGLSTSIDDHPADALEPEPPPPAVKTPISQTNRNDKLRHPTDTAPPQKATVAVDKSKSQLKAQPEPGVVKLKTSPNPMSTDKSTGRPEESKVEGQMRDGRRIGKWVHRRDDGSKLSEGEYQVGKQHGPWTYWHPNGKPMKQGEYRDGKLDGVWTEWYENGQKKMETEYQAGTRNGRFTYWNTSGKQLFNKVYFDGKEVK